VNAWSDKKLHLFTKKKVLLLFTKKIGITIVLVMYNVRSLL